MDLKDNDEEQENSENNEDEGENEEDKNQDEEQEEEKPLSTNHKNNMKEYIKQYGTEFEIPVLFIQDAEIYPKKERKYFVKVSKYHLPKQQDSKPMEIWTFNQLGEREDSKFEEIFDDPKFYHASLSLMKIENNMLKCLYEIAIPKAEKYDICFS